MKRFGILDAERGSSRLSGSSVLLIWLLAACAPPTPDDPPPTVVDDAAIADEEQGRNWLAYGRTHSERRFSPLTQINDSNVSQLSPDWVVELPDAAGLVATPLVVDGILYFTGSMNIVRAVDATSGEQLWRFDPKVREHASRLRAGFNFSRGVSFWKGRVYTATWDGRLIAIDAATGEEVWSTMTVDPELPLYITGAPKAFKGKVLVGNGGTEHGAARGYVTAYDAETGEQAWRFFIVPGNPADGFENDALEMAAKTWTGEWWIHGGGGNAWHGITYDAELDQLYIGTGNGSPSNRKIRSPGGGDNLFLASIVALDPDTGDYLWHYQTTPGETWDYNSGMDIVLADLEIDGRERKVLMHAPKNGFFYVIDRSDGALISADAFTPVTWASHVDLETGRPVEIEGARFESGSVVMAPSAHGGHNWPAMSFSPQTGLAYYPAMHLKWEFSDRGIDLENWRSVNWQVGSGLSARDLGSSREDGLHATLQAWDPVRRQLAWEVPLPPRFNPGTVTTAGNLVFQGRVDGTFAAYRADDGEELWSMKLGLGISAPPITYSVGDRQYVALLVGWGNSDGVTGESTAGLGWAYGLQTRILVAFSLDGGATLPRQPDPQPAVPIAADFEVDPLLAGNGVAVFAGCMACHGISAIGGGLAPDLRASEVVLSEGAFAGIVRNGRAERGMPAYAALSDEELLAMRHYIRQQAELALVAADD